MVFDDLFDCVQYAVNSSLRLGFSMDSPNAKEIMTTLYAMQFLYHRDFHAGKPSSAVGYGVPPSSLKERAVEMQLSIDRHQPMRPGGKFATYIEWLKQSVPVTEQFGIDSMTCLVAAGLDRLVDAFDVPERLSYILCESLYLAVVDYFRACMLEDSPSSYRALPSYEFFETVAEDFAQIRSQINE